MWQIPNWLTYCIFFIDFFVAFFFLSVFIIFKFKEEEKPKAYEKLEMTFVLPAYNESKTIAKSIESIKHLNYPKEKIKIIIVDDSSTDNTLEIARKLAKKYSGIEVYTKPNSGKADTVNFGIKKSKTELVVVLDTDTILKKDILEKSIPLFTDKTIAAVTSRYKPLNTEKLIEKIQNVEYTFTGFYRKIMGRILSLPVTPAFTIFRKEFFVKYGYFDKDNLTEDFEMGLRIQKNHYNIGYVTESYALTDVPDTLRKFFRQRVRWGYGTIYNCLNYKQIFFNKRYGDLGMFVLPSWFFGMLLVSFTFILGMYAIIEKTVKCIQMLAIGWLPSLSFNFNGFLISLLDLRIMLAIFGIFIGFIVFFLINKELNEKVKIKHYIVFLLFYLWILAFIGLYSFVIFILRKKPKW